MAVILAVIAAVAGGNLAVTSSPARPHVGRRVVFRATGQVGDKGHLYLYRETGRNCGQSAGAERRRGVRMVSRAIDGSFDLQVFHTPRRTGRLLVCAYLYADACDAAGQNCGPATGLPPDAGFAQIRVRVRAAAARPSGSRATP
ncbi:MAG: hypothetical protein QOH13_556 [Thermoleophilaceae bacterium]|nr:hypothetical protein [Thermoleophilaceae bacterium]